MFPLHYQTLLNMLWFYKHDSILNATFFGIYKDNRHIWQKYTMSYDFGKVEQCLCQIRAIQM